MKISLENAVVVGLATAGSVFVIGRMRKEGLTPLGVVLAGILGPTTIYGLGKLLGD